ncbi:endonuclease [Texas Phoenix palm phytoplasma]|uniref:Endonuclease n=1 Tax=Texas Phoenix palm phytoplasma TaxID=176709 RepID=A0ABS5BIQ8_9MOLU|nr:YqaJ viral recombinase family protein [Texas Phoenix palm phytoplasma]MBP3059429.1 endonuclease [Texas Phoenix palm phytoplasma]
MFQFFNLTQNSFEWHEHRKKYINASEVAAIMGLNPFESEKSIFRRKLFNEKIKENKAIIHGRNLEPEAREFFNNVNKSNFKPVVFVKEFFSASLDGWDKFFQSILEIKCPISLDTKVWNNFFFNDVVPIYYYAQIQAQLYCAEVEKAFFLVYLNYQNAKIKEIKKDLVFINKMYEKCRFFYFLLEEARQILYQL